MSPAAREATIVVAASTALGLPAAALTSLAFVTMTGQALTALVAIAGVVLALIAANRLARAAERRLGSKRLPWALWATATVTAWVAVTALVEIGMLFAANDEGRAAGALIPLMVATGAVGLLAPSVALIISATLVVRLSRSAPLAV